MNQHVGGKLIGIMGKLSKECQTAINPNHCIFEPTKEGSKHHFRVPNSSRKQIIGFGNLRLSRSDKFGSDEPCVIVGVDAALLNDKDPIYIAHHCKNAKFETNGVGLVQFAVCEEASKNYQLALKALIEASKNLLAGRRYNWYKPPSIASSAPLSQRHII